MSDAVNLIIRLLYRYGIFQETCGYCGIRYKAAGPCKYPTCVPCFMDGCAEIERRTGMFVGHGPVTDSVYRKLRESGVK